jgi:DNA-cytosine methyltransferase
VRRIAAQHGKELLDPYLDKSVCEYFLRFDQEQLSPLSKPHIRHALRDHLKRIPKRTLAVGIQLQKGSGVCALFSTLLNDEAINRFDKKYTTVSALCQRWGCEVRNDGGSYLAETQALSPPPSAAKFTLKPGVYRPYRLEEVWSSPGHGLTAIETFAGGGGSGLGLHQAGYKVVLANEFVPEAARTYRANFPQTALDMRDIREIAVSPAAIEAFLLQAGLKTGEPSLLAGSFPCAEFSNLGGGLSDQSRLRTYSDTKQRGMSTLIFEFVKLARGVMPEAVVAENVPALATTYRQLLDGALDILRYTAVGRERVYYANYAVLSADDFGTPQARRRLFIVALRRDVAHSVGITTDAGVAMLFPGPTHLPVSVRTALAGLHQTSAHVDPWRAEMTKSSSLRHFVNKLPPDPCDWLKLRDVGLGEKSWFTLVRCAWDRPAPTLTVLGQLPNSFSGAIHPEYDRKFTLPELKRLTGLPDDFRLTGTLNQAVERVCRMVPPALMRAVAESIYETALRPYREQRK